MFIIFLCISLIVFTIGVGYAISMKREDRIPWQSFLLIILLFTAIAMWITVLPLVCLLAAKGHEFLCGLAEGKRWPGKLSRIAGNCICLYMLYTVFSGFLRCLSWYGYIQLF